MKRPSWSFIVSKGERLLPVSGKVVLCLDVLFHILDQDAYSQTIQNICAYSEERVFVHTWHKNPLGNRSSDGLYLAFRPLDKELFSRAGFDCVAEETSPSNVNPYGAMFVFKRRGQEGNVPRDHSSRIQ